MSIEPISTAELIRRCLEAANGAGSSGGPANLYAAAAARLALLAGEETQDMHYLVVYRRGVNKPLRLRLTRAHGTQIHDALFAHLKKYGPQGWRTEGGVFFNMEQIDLYHFEEEK